MIFECTHTFHEHCTYSALSRFCKTFVLLQYISQFSYPLCSKVLMLKPRVGEIVSISSPLNFFKIVVFPALSNPLNKVKEW